MLRSEFFKRYVNRRARDRRYMAGLIRATPLAGLRHTVAQVIAKRRSLFRMTGVLTSIKVPTLVIRGQYDYPCRNSARVLAETIPGARLKIIPDAGHMSPLEQPGAFNAALLEFLTANS
jgi:pimeloyl-ACP methyl ester carboxylesterase